MLENKKNHKLLFAILCVVLVFLNVGCSNSQESDNTENDIWGIQLTASEITPTGLTLICRQSGGEATGELHTGSFYSLEKKTGNQWSPAEMLPQKYDVAWTSEAWIIPMDDKAEWKVDWEWLYGTLPPGNYRIGKEISDFRKTGDYDTKFYYAEFEVPEIK